jgi:hypothetical protein
MKARAEFIPLVYADHSDNGCPRQNFATGAPSSRALGSVDAGTSRDRQFLMLPPSRPSATAAEFLLDFASFAMPVFRFSPALLNQYRPVKAIGDAR